MKQRSLSSAGARCAWIALIAISISGGCDTGTPQGSIRGVSQSAPKLEEFDSRGNYTPYYTTAELNTSRYFHVGLLGANGRAYVFFGSDERGLAALDTVEFFDQSTFDAALARPDSQAGLWVDTNFEGDPMIASAGGRISFTATQLPDNRIILMGGSGDLGAGQVIGRVEIFDPLTREFSGVEREMTTPRFSHTVVQISTGELVVIGGQVQDNTANTTGAGGQGNQNQNPLNQGGLGGIGGGQGVQQNITVFPSTRSIEIFSPKDETFAFLKTINNENAVLQSTRGRSFHAMTRIAGPDNRLNSSDDIYVIVGGVQTLSAASGQAPITKGIAAGTGVLSIEVFNPQTRIVTLLAGVKIVLERTLEPEAVNLGLFNDFTPDGVRGMGNALLVTNGGPLFDEFFIANFTPGLGPAQGIRLFQVVEDRFASHVQGSEYPQAITERVAMNSVALPRPLETVPGVEPRGTWVFALAGAPLAPGGVTTIDAGCVFDPYFSLRSAFLFNLDPTNLENERQTERENFLGVVGCWLTLDGFVTQSLDEFSTTPDSRWAKTNSGPFRVWCRNIQILGVDGVRNTFDDRILLSGGGDNLNTGGEPVIPSAEVFLPPGSSQR